MCCILVLPRPVLSRAGMRSVRASPHPLSVFPPYLLKIAWFSVVLLVATWTFSRLLRTLWHAVSPFAARGQLQLHPLQPLVLGPRDPPSPSPTSTRRRQTPPVSRIPRLFWATAPDPVAHTHPGAHLAQCAALYSSWTLSIYSDAAARSLIHTEFPQFASTFDQLSRIEQVRRRGGSRRHHPWSSWRRRW